jgi:hypothetical protein
VFPEYGLTTTAVSQSRPLCIAFGQDVLPLNSNPCDDIRGETKINNEVRRDTG